MQKLYKSMARKGRRRATMRADTEALQIKGPQTTIKKADAEAIQIKGSQREKKGDNKESGSGGYTNQGHADKGERLQ